MKIKTVPFSIYLPGSINVPPKFICTIQVEVDQQEGGEEFLTQESRARIEEIRKREIEKVYLELKIPAYIIESLKRYAKDHIRTGGFLHSILSNDLYGALSKADWENTKAFVEVCKYIWNYLPENSWGSPEAVDKWINYG